MTTDATTETAPALVLTPPEPVATITSSQAVGLVPVEDAKRSELEARVDSFVGELAAQDINSPEFGRRVDAITAIGGKEIRDAAGAQNDVARAGMADMAERFREKGGEIYIPNEVG